MTIEKATRDRWRALFVNPNVMRGPWAAFHGLHSSEVTCPQYRCAVALNVERENAAFIAEAREGWPGTLEALECAERTADDLRNIITIQEAELAAGGRTLAETRARLFESVELARVAYMAESRIAGDFNRLSTSTRESLDRYARLTSAVSAWVKHRFAAGLVAAWEDFSRES